MTSVDETFRRRGSSIPTHGLGLSVDVYAPDPFDLLEALGKQGLAYGYLEVFKAPAPALARVRRRVPTTLLEYHGDGLWLTQPDLETGYPLQAELAQATAHLQVLGSHWMSHECAAKQMAGYSFGTYLPPLFTRDSAEVTARNVRRVQAALGRTALSAVQLPSAHVQPERLSLYSRASLPREILHWGGDLRDVFPETCRRLEAEGIARADFTDFWFRSPRPVRAPTISFCSNSTGSLNSCRKSCRTPARRPPAKPQTCAGRTIWPTSRVGT